uniref:Uncharacterized protein n=1 Tax=Odontella aurita TaxID=265563 RepID=A0A7S4K7J0_9STRA
MARPLTVSADGLAVTLEGNTHRALELPESIELTRATQIDFDFTLEDMEEVQAICLDKDRNMDGKNCFIASGHQNINWKKLSPQTAVGETRHYKIPVGMYFTGTGYKYLIFMQDNDSSNRDTGKSTFANVEIGEAPDLLVKVNGKDTFLPMREQVAAFDSGQDSTAYPLAVSPDGLSVRLEGNIHRAVPLPAPVVITRNTNLDFDFTLVEVKDIHSICLIETPSSNRNCVILAGTQDWERFNVDYTQVGETRHYSVPVGLFFPTAAGSAGVQYLAFLHDNDTSQRWRGDSTYSNIALSKVTRPALTIKVNDVDVAIDMATQWSHMATQDTKVHLLEVLPGDDRSVHLSGNVHKSVDLPSPIVVTEATELDLDITVDEIAEAHSICLEDSKAQAQSHSRCILLGGTQRLSSWITINPKALEGETTHAHIAIGMYYTGTFDQIVFMQDQDANRDAGRSKFSNIEFRERPSLNVNVNGIVQSLPNYQKLYNSDQDKNGDLMEVSDDGMSLTMYGNSQKALAFNDPVMVTEDTVLSFRLQVDVAPEITSLCLDEDLVRGEPARCIMAGGFQRTGLGSIIYKGIEQTYVGEGENLYHLRLRDFYEGEMNYIGFLQDNDADEDVGLSTFSDIKIYDVQPSCLEDKSFSFSMTECTLDAFLGEVETVMGNPANGCSNTDAWAELMSFFDASSDVEIEERIGNICSSAYVPSTLPFNQMLGEEDQFLGEFFDGGSSWNYEVDEAGGPDLSADAARIMTASEQFDGKRGISWPNVHNFKRCELRAAMCCYVSNRAVATPVDGSEACYMDFKNARETNHVRDGYSIYYDGTSAREEGPLSCSGFAWGDDAGYADAALRGNTLFHVAMKTGLLDGGDVEQLPGAPMCGCVEQMPVVTRADCTKTVAVQTVKVTYDPVTRFFAEVDITSIAHEDCGDLATYYDELVTDGKALAREKVLLEEHLVGEGQCGAAIAGFLGTKGFVFA